MSDPFTIKKIGKIYHILNQGVQVTTPAGNPYEAEVFDLAKIVCQDMNLFGPDPLGHTPSCVSLQAAYCDYGRVVPRADLIEDILVEYDPQRDIALAAWQAYTNLPPAAPSIPGVASGEDLHPVVYFGPPITADAIQQWLESLSRRALVTVRTISEAYSTILCSYRLLFKKRAIPIDSMVYGLVEYGYQLQFDQYLADDRAGLQEQIKQFFIKAKVYASFHDA